MKHIENVTIIKGQDAFIEASIQLIEQTSRYLRIRSSLLDPDLFDQKPFNEALSAFARRSRNSEVQILVDFPDRILDLDTVLNLTNLIGTIDGDGSITLTGHADNEVAVNVQPFGAPGTNKVPWVTFIGPQGPILGA